ncbi:MAG: septum formation initiator family protein [bacterium]|nr:septum formation initiator family protein [bacterium]
MGEQRKKQRSFVKSRFVWIASVAVAAFIALSAGREWYIQYMTDREIRELEAQAARLEARRLELIDLVKKFEQRDFVEQEARLEFGLQRQGESVAVVRASEEKPKTESAVHEPGVSNLKLWWYYFTGKRN